MSEKLPNMLDRTIAKIREMVDVNSVMGDPIVTPDGTTVIPVSKISIGLGGGGSDFASKNAVKLFNLCFNSYIIGQTKLSKLLGMYDPIVRIGS